MKRRRGWREMRGEKLHDTTINLMMPKGRRMDRLTFDGSNIVE